MSTDLTSMCKLQKGYSFVSVPHNVTNNATHKSGRNVEVSTVRHRVYFAKKILISQLRQIQDCEWSQNLKNVLYNYVLVSDIATR